MGLALAGAVHAHSILRSAIAWAAHDGATRTRPEPLTLADAVDTRATGFAVTRAGPHAAVHSGVAIGTVAGAVVAVSVIAALVGALQHGAVQTGKLGITHARSVDTLAVS